MKTTLIAFAGAALCLQAPVAAQEAEAESTEAKSERLICKRYAKTGTRVVKKFCHTKAEWDAMADRAKAEGTDLQGRGAVNHVGQGG